MIEDFIIEGTHRRRLTGVIQQAALRPDGRLEGYLEADFYGAKDGSPIITGRVHGKWHNVVWTLHDTYFIASYREAQV